MFCLAKLVLSEIRLPQLVVDHVSSALQGSTRALPTFTLNAMFAKQDCSVQQVPRLAKPARKAPTVPLGRTRAVHVLLASFQFRKHLRIVFNARLVGSKKLKVRVAALCAGLANMQLPVQIRPVVLHVLPVLVGSSVMLSAKLCAKSVLQGLGQLAKKASKVAQTHPLIAKFLCSVSGTTVR